jgi:hypothetical protein
MTSVLTLSAVDREFEQIKDYKIEMCCFSAKHAALRRKRRDCLARNQDNVLSWATCLSTDCCFSDLKL